MITALDELLRSMTPSLHEGEFVFCLADSGVPGAIATFVEEEGLTVVLPRSVADERALVYTSQWAWITLTVHSDLNAVGFLAAISRELAAAGISCNVFSALYHDHLFVNHDRSADAMRVLHDLQATSERNSHGS